MGILADRRRKKIASKQDAIAVRNASREARERSERLREEFLAKFTMPRSAPVIRDLPPSEAEEAAETEPASETGPAASTPFHDRHGRPLFLNGFWSPAHLFLVSAGPSIRSLDLSLLHRRGICTMGLNNSPAIFRPDFWAFIDPPKKFHDAIWRDPGVLKFCPRPFMQTKPLREKRGGANEAGEGFRWIPGPGGVVGNAQHFFPADCPAVVGYSRSACFDPGVWLEEGSHHINWGNAAKHAAKNGRRRILNVMLAALGIAYQLGFRVVNLLGCDFQMDAAKPYAFDQAKNLGGVQNNNEMFELLNSMFGELRPHFDKAGFRVQNCNPKSGLTAFDYCRFDAAVRDATSHVPQDPLDTRGWYGD